MYARPDAELDFNAPHYEHLTHYTLARHKANANDLPSHTPSAQSPVQCLCRSHVIAMGCWNVELKVVRTEVAAGSGIAALRGMHDGQHDLIQFIALLGYFKLFVVCRLPITETCQFPDCMVSVANQMRIQFCYCRSDSHTRTDTSFHHSRATRV